MRNEINQDKLKEWLKNIEKYERTEKYIIIGISVVSFINVILMSLVLWWCK